MAVFSTAVFAAPLSVAGSLDTASSEFSLAGQTSADPNGFDDLFADVNAAALTQKEAAAVEGDGIYSYFVASIINLYLLPGIQTYVYNAQVANGTNPSRAQFNAIGTSVIVGGIIQIIGVALPW
jgi:hypothetical protein